MRHHNLDDIYTMEGFAVWQQWQTNRNIVESNRLLEQIRRSLLTPAERAAEDAQRRAATLQREKNQIRLAVALREPPWC
jgi:hypothetical protein